MSLSKDLLVLGTTLLGLLTVSAIGVEAAPVQDPPAPPTAATELPSARKVVDRYLEVTGTAKFAPKYKSQKVTGTIELVGMGVKGTSETYTMRPAFMLTTVEMAMVGKVMTGDDGKVAWRIHPMMGEQLLEGAELAQMRLRNAPFESPFKKKEHFEVMENVGVEKFGDKPCYKLRFVEKPYEGVKGDPEDTKAVREYFEFYEVETGLLVGMTMISATPQGDMPSTVTMSGYRKYGELLAPEEVLIEAAAVKILAKTTAMEFNTLEDAKIFDLPPGIAALVKAEEKVDDAKEGKEGGEGGE